HLPSFPTRRSSDLVGRANRARPNPMHAPLFNAPSLSSVATPTLAMPTIAAVAAASIVPVVPIPPSPSRIPSNSPWTPERIEQLKSCFSAGMTCSEIGAAIGVSRNAVIGKIHRLGLSGERPAGARARATDCPPPARHPRRSTQRHLLRLAYSAPPPGEEGAL